MDSWGIDAPGAPGSHPCLRRRRGKCRFDRPRMPRAYRVRADHGDRPRPRSRPRRGQEPRSLDLRRPAPPTLPKAEVAAAHLHRIATARRPVARPVPLSVRTERAYRLAADADVIMCCVDNAEAREVLNHLAYANCLRLIDGGVLVESRERLLSAKWRVHLIGPDMQLPAASDEVGPCDFRTAHLTRHRRVSMSA